MKDFELRILYRHGVRWAGIFTALHITPQLLESGDPLALQQDGTGRILNAGRIDLLEN